MDYSEEEYSWGWAWKKVGEIDRKKDRCIDVQIEIDWYGNLDSK